MQLGGVIANGVEKVADTVKNISQAVNFSFVSFGKKKNKKENRTPSKATVELIKQIHAGFDPIDLSVKRWKT